MICLNLQYVVKVPQREDDANHDYDGSDTRHPACVTNRNRENRANYEHEDTCHHRSDLERCKTKRDRDLHHET